MGINAPPSFALFADSGAITPLTSPSPKVLFFILRLPCPYANQSITAAPMPGREPRVEPSAEHRRHRNQLSRTSRIPLSCPLRVSIFPSDILCLFDS